MTEEGLQLDPEIEEILRDVASDPRSSLLRVDRPGKWLPLHERDEPVSAGESFLTSVERHMVEFHREQVADLLYRAGKIAYAREKDPRVWWELGDESAASSDLLLAEGFEGPHDDELELVRRALRSGEAGAGPSEVELAQASLRLVSSPKPKLLTAWAFLKAGAGGSARDVLSTIPDAVSAAMLGHREDCAGYASFREADFLRAGEHYQRCSQIDSGLPLAATFWLLSAVLLADSRGFERAIDLAQNALDSEPSATGYLTTMFSEAPQLMPDESARRTAADFALSRADQLHGPLAGVLAAIAEGSK